MKDLGTTKQILGIRINRDKTREVLKLSQTKYIEWVLEKFNMQKTKAVGAPLGSCFKLSDVQSHKLDAEKENMAKVLYTLQAIMMRGEVLHVTSTL